MFQMTPYYYKTSRRDQERLERLEALKTQVQFSYFHLSKRMISTEKMSKLAI